jgi:hypothetical protein
VQRAVSVGNNGTVVDRLGAFLQNLVTESIVLTLTLAYTGVIVYDMAVGNAPDSEACTFRHCFAKACEPFPNVVRMLQP